MKIYLLGAFQSLCFTIMFLLIGVPWHKATWAGAFLATGLMLHSLGHYLVFTKHENNAR